jgi:(S)-citramalyl-CoA lyase
MMRTSEETSRGGLSSVPVRRSLLFVPGNRPERFMKALAAGPDVVVIDLEDAVAPAEKAAARRKALDALADLAGSAPAAEIYLRLNAPRTRAGLDDLAALLDHKPRLGGILLPKVEGQGDIELVDALMDEAGYDTGLAAVIETISGLDSAYGIAKASPRMSFLMFGGADLAAELRVAIGWEPLIHARADVVRAAARAGIDALDMPFLGLDDPDGHDREIAAAAQLGFTGKSAIHPNQIDAINRHFTPDGAAVAQARRIVDASTRAAGGVTLLDGKLVERPILLGAHRVLAVAARTGAFA